MSRTAIVRRAAAFSPILFLIAATLAGPSHASSAPLRRLALVVGASRGGAQRVKLRYATEDAKSLAQVLHSLGGIETRDLTLLLEPDRERLEAGLSALRRRLAGLRRNGSRIEVIVYYSGHSDEHGLLLNGERLSYEALRRAIAVLPADVRLAIIDSCASGALTRQKGGVRRSPFAIDNSTEVRGQAFLTSASADEAAQESDRLKLSFFTHHLISGLRGAADANRDKRVTLNEAYQYAFSRTLRETVTTASGAQHANYDMQLAGRGNLVLTDLRQPSAALVLPATLKGELYLRDAAKRLVAEVRLTGDGPLTLGIEPGSYTLQLRSGVKTYRGKLRVAAKEQHPLQMSDLVRAQQPLASVIKGSEAPLPSRTPRHDPLPRHLLSVAYQQMGTLSDSATVDDFIYIQALPFRYNAKLSRQARHSLQLRYGYRLKWLYLGAALGYRRVNTRYREDDALHIQVLPYHYAEHTRAIEVDLLATVESHLPLERWLRPHWLWRWLQPFAGIDVGGGWIAQRRQSERLEVNAAAAGRSLSEIDDSQVSSSLRSRSRLLGAFYLRARAGLSIPLWRKYAWLSIYGHYGLAVSRRDLDDARGERAIALGQALAGEGGAGAAIAAGF